MTLGLAWTAQPLPSATALMPAFPLLATAATFRPVARDVDNWRREAALALDLSPESALALAVGDDLRGTSRCVKLNNYWCIKRAGWAGEIAADGEGHVAFASAREGAAVAALLLRRYYVDYGLKSARAIVSRWAPAQCGTPSARGGGAPRIASAADGGGLARRGIGNTLRARWLASHTLGGLPKAAARSPSTISRGPARVARSAPPTRRSVVADRGARMIDTPIIMAGLGAPTTEPVRLAMLPSYPGLAMGPAPGGRQPSLPSLTSCTGDSVRIANYAAKTADGVAMPDADLALFDGDGKPTANLARVMANMASVEIGPLRASDTLVAAGVAAVAARTKP